MKKFIFINLMISIVFYCEGQDSIWLTAPREFVERLSSPFDITSLSPSRFVVAYEDGNTWEGKMMVGNIQNDTNVVFGNKVTFNSSNSNYEVEVSRLSETRFLLTYSNSYATRSRVCEVLMNSFIYMGEPIVLSYYTIHQIAQTGISDDKFLIAYENNCAIGNVDDQLNITIDSVYKFTETNLGTQSYVTTDTLSASRFAIAYNDGDGKVVIGSVASNDEITFGNTFQFSSSETFYNFLVGIDQDHFAVVFANAGPYKRGVLKFGTIDQEGQITFTFNIFNENITEGVTATQLSNDNIMIAYVNWGSDGFSYIVNADVSGLSPEFSNSQVFNEYVVFDGSNPVSGLNDNNFIVNYQDAGDFTGFYRIGSTNGFLHTGISDNGIGNNIRIYPNPASDVINIELTKVQGDINAEMTLYNICGSRIFSQHLVSVKASINIENLKAGVYIINIQNADIMMTKRLVVM